MAFAKGYDQIEFAHTLIVTHSQLNKKENFYQATCTRMKILKQSVTMS